MALTEITRSDHAYSDTSDHARHYAGHHAALGPLLRLGFGAALVLAALGLWLVPAAASAPSLLLIKLGASVGLMTWGLGLFSAALEQRV